MDDLNENNETGFVVEEVNQVIKVINYIVIRIVY